MSGHLQFGDWRKPLTGMSLNFCCRSSMVLAALALTLIATPANSKEMPSMFVNFGVGIESCAKSISNTHYNDSFIWVMGYFSGLNVGLQSHHVGHSTDGEGIFGEVVLACKAEPSISLYDAASQVYARLRRQNR